MCFRNKTTRLKDIILKASSQIGMLLILLILQETKKSFTDSNLSEVLESLIALIL
jgi:hypothetical protein